MAIKFRVTANLNDAKKKTDRMVQRLTALPTQATDYFRSVTPIRSGNARRNTRLQGKNTILGDYPYAERLDQGYSDQAPQGMTQPTEQWINKQLRDIERGR